MCVKCLLRATSVQLLAQVIDKAVKTSGDVLPQNFAFVLLDDVKDITTFTGSSNLETPVMVEALRTYADALEAQAAAQATQQAAEAMGEPATSMAQ